MINSSLERNARLLIDSFNSLRLLPLSLLISLLHAQITKTVYTDTIVKITIIKVP